MKVYIVFLKNGDLTNIPAVFDTVEKAEKWFEENKFKSINNAMEWWLKDYWNGFILEREVA